MKKIILFFGSFDPLHKGHISIIENAIKQINANYLYLGLNKCSNKGKLTSLFHRKNMLKFYCKSNDKCKILNFTFDYKNIDKTYQNIFNFTKKNAQYYILIGDDQINQLTNWYKFNLIYEKFNFIVARRHHSNNNYLNDSKFIFIDHDFKNISSSDIKKGNYDNTINTISDYILNNNIYLKEQIKPYLSIARYNHTLSTSKTALLINQKANLGLDRFKVEKATLLHDIAKEVTINTVNKIMKENYPSYINESNKIIHQYIGEYMAKEYFFVKDKDILNAIKYHTTGRSNMSLLEKLVYVADKIEPTRNYSTKKLINECIYDFNSGFIKVLTNNKAYLKSKNINVTNKDTINCFKYYL